MLKNPLPINEKYFELHNKRNHSYEAQNKVELCPNCGNTSPIFQHVQNGMLVCFICRKASVDKDFISAY